LTIDDIEREVADLNNYQPEDFAMFTVREIEKKAFLKNAVYNVSLMTQEYFHGKYYNSRKKIELIQAEYPTSEKEEVLYGKKHIETADGKTIKISPENYEASIFHQLRAIDPGVLIVEFPKLINQDESKSFSIIIRSRDRRSISFMKLPTI